MSESPYISYPSEDEDSKHSVDGESFRVRMEEMQRVEKADDATARGLNAANGARQDVITAPQRSKQGFPSRHQSATPSRTLKTIPLSNLVRTPHFTFMPLDSNRSRETLAESTRARLRTPSARLSHSPDLPQKPP
ncbi:hypothetical protein NliqN6_3431 [Naganishia liquefaciens]|uniref:Uncharacterized protein n=1 Tax=Naganishia liquefaciens TaxID=104408 RepID=A0A8H3TU02_9TREE|nr:hypothetical protein NliqN6_3431 [Naganishia liquefaciens]